MVDNQSVKKQTIGRRILLNTGSMAASSMWRIIISFLLQLFVARWLGIEALGQYTVALAYLNVSQILSELGLQNLLVRDLAQHPYRRASVFRTTISLQVVAAFVAWGALWALSSIFSYSAEFRSILWFVGASLPFYAVTTSCQIIFQAVERMDLVMVVELVINTLIAGLSIVVLTTGGTVATLIGVLIITQGISAAICLVLLRQHQLLQLEPAREKSGDMEDRRSLNYTTQEAPNRHLDKQRLSEVIVLLRQAVPFYGMALADVLLQRLDILLLSIFAGDLVTGIYSAAYNVVRILLKLIQSYWKALYPTLSRLRNSGQEKFRALAASSMHYGIFLTLFAATIAAVATGPILELIYGVESLSSTNAFWVLIWTSPLYFVELYAITLLMVDDRPYASLAVMLTHLVVVGVALPLLSGAYLALGAAFAVIIATAVGTIASMGYLERAKLPFSPSETAWLVVPAIATLVMMQWAPISGILRAGAGAVLYLALSWVCGIVSLGDLRAAKSILTGRSAAAAD